MKPRNQLKGPLLTPLNFSLSTHQCRLLLPILQPLPLEHWETSGLLLIRTLVHHNHGLNWLSMRKQMFVLCSVFSINVKFLDIIFDFFCVINDFHSYPLCKFVLGGLCCTKRHLRQIFGYISSVCCLLATLRSCSWKKYRFWDDKSNLWKRTSCFANKLRTVVFIHPLYATSCFTRFNEIVCRSTFAFFQILSCSFPCLYSDSTTGVYLCVAEWW